MGAENLHAVGQDLEHPLDGAALDAAGVDHRLPLGEERGDPPADFLHGRNRHRQEHRLGLAHFFQRGPFRIALDPLRILVINTQIDPIPEVPIGHFPEPADTNQPY